jgi:hypothetical protein
MAVDELVAVVSPPAEPAEAEGDWAAIERALGTALPGDYKAFIRVYGSGCLDQFVWVLNPFSTNKFLNLIERGRETLAALGQLQASHPAAGVADPLFPTPGGLLPWGLTDNGDVLWWSTVPGPPERWPVVVTAPRDEQVARYAVTMTTFLASILGGEVQCDLFPDDFPSARPSFTGA